MRSLSFGLVGLAWLLASCGDSETSGVDPIEGGSSDGSAASGGSAGAAGAGGQAGAAASGGSAGAAGSAPDTSSGGASGSGASGGSAGVSGSGVGGETTAGGAAGVSGTGAGGVSGAGGAAGSSGDAGPDAPFDGGTGVDFDGGTCALEAPPCSGANLFANPGFESIPGAGTGQGLMPSSWVIVSQTPDTWSNDGSYGLAPADYGDFTGVTAYQGIRWVGGWSGAAERFGQTLSAALVPGTEYRISAMLHDAVRVDLANAGSYEIGLADAVAHTTLEVVGYFCPTTPDAWVPRSFRFVAPAGAAGLPVVIFRPYAVAGGGAYPGADAVTLEACP